MRERGGPEGTARVAFAASAAFAPWMAHGTDIVAFGWPAHGEWTTDTDARRSAQW